MNRRLFTLDARDPIGSLKHLAVRHLAHSFTHLARHTRAHWLAYGCVFSIWGLAFTRVFIDPTPRLPVLFNWTPSVPYRVAIVRYGGQKALGRGDFIIYAFEGDAQRTYPGLHAQPFFKQIRGVPGDRITVAGRQVFVNNQAVGIAKAHTFDGHPLDPIGALVIPAGHYYVQGSNPDSFDSRYLASGLVRTSQVIGKVTPIF